MRVIALWKRAETSDEETLRLEQLRVAVPGEFRQLELDMMRDAYLLGENRAAFDIACEFMPLCSALAFLQLFRKWPDAARVIGRPSHLVRIDLVLVEPPELDLFIDGNE